VTLAALVTSATQTRLAQLLTDNRGLSPAAARLSLVHYAAQAIAAALIAPLALDGVRLGVRGGQIGLTLSPSADVSSVWIGRLDALPHWVGSVHVGATAWMLLSPIGERTRRSLGIGQVAMSVLMFEALEHACLRHARSGTGLAGENWVDEFLAGTGFVPPTPRRFATIRPDDGADVSIPVRRVCCVLDRDDSCNSCPTCPLEDVADRDQRIVDWLRSLDDEGFLGVVGRPRTPTESAR
jgi:hypothetical protein